MRTKPAGGLSEGFAPLATKSARLLIIGSLPGRASLLAGQYYAQPRNAFWPLMGALFGAGSDLPYAERVRRLVSQGVAVWDVCGAARREGSLDTSIEGKSVRANDFAAFFAAHRHVGQIAFNGQAAARLYERHVLPTLDAHLGALPRRVLPSSSPAHAALRFAGKLERWRILEELLR